MKLAPLIKTMTVLSAGRFPCDKEVDLQNSVEWMLKHHGIKFEREKQLGPKDRVDFLTDGGVAIEIKIKGSPKAIYRQLQRYAEHDSVSYILLLTSKTIGLPEEINGRPARVLSIGKAWL